ncbi:MAG: URC4/urg3 family protein [Alphaproteobacteria bacterium]|nr:URC4/urg3 family protein [Alphaproteobacteria bacterium]
MTDNPAVAYLRSPRAIRERCAMVFAAAERGETRHFALDLAKLSACTHYVARVMQDNYPRGDVPFHARWRHFAVGGVDRWKPLAARFVGRDPIERVRAAYELAIVSVLLDAGAGAEWRYREAAGGTWSRSEGLAVASIDMFASGAFSADADDPLRVDARVLAGLADDAVARGFQVSAANPLVGVSGRTDLLRRLGRAIDAQPALFGTTGRLGGLVDHLLAKAGSGALPAAAILSAVLEGLGPIWPARVTIDGVALGDVGRHPAARAADATSGLVPFHKLSQWLTYSLIEPLEWLGLRVVELDALTGLPEYRNGGLFLDAGVIVPRHAAVLAEPHDATSELVVEWRALTVCLLDRLAAAMRAELLLDSERLPLAKVLEGGTWAAGRKIARERRGDGRPPITVVSDGTVF